MPEQRAYAGRIAQRQETPVVAWKDRPFVEVVPGKVSGVPLLKGTRMPADAIMENYTDGVAADEIAEVFQLPADAVCGLLAFAVSKTLRSGRSLRECTYSASCGAPSKRSQACKRAQSKSGKDENINESVLRVWSEVMSKGRQYLSVLKELRVERYCSRRMDAFDIRNPPALKMKISPERKQ